MRGKGCILFDIFPFQVGLHLGFLCPHCTPGAFNDGLLIFIGFVDEVVEFQKLLCWEREGPLFEDSLLEAQEVDFWIECCK